jgi:histidine ammonia-lyase
MTAAAGPPVVLSGTGLTIDDVIEVARGRRAAVLDPAARSAMDRSQRWVYRTVQDDVVVYGVNTGFGPLAQTTIRADQTRDLSRKVILACLAGTGDPLPDDVVRAMLLIRANTLAGGWSGVRPVVVETLCAMLAAGVHPLVPGKGSLGASGDLAPLAHIAAVAADLSPDEPAEGGPLAIYDGKVVRAAEAMELAGIARIQLEAKEGLALTNGTTMMVAAGALAIADARAAIEHAEIAAALSFEGLLGLTAALDPRLHELTAMPGQIATAARMRTLLGESRLVDSRPGHVQDAYSLRCTPQVVGPIRDMVEFLATRIEIALNSATDNPLIVPSHADADDFAAISGGNFHGAGPALWLDTVGIAVAELASIGERRVFRLLTPELSEGLPSMLARNSGLDSGLMMAQYTAAALVSDNKTLAHPDSVDSIPSSANQEDHVSMGANSARHALEIIDNVRTVVAIEFLVASQAIDLRPDGPARLGRGTAAAYRVIRDVVPPLESDRAVSPDILAIEHLIRSGRISAAVREAVGPA